LVWSAPSQADVVGTLNIAGDVRFTANAADFLPQAGTTGQFRTTAFQTGDFAGLGNTTGQIQDLDLAGLAVGSPISVVPFLRLDADPNVRLDLTFIEPGAYSAADIASPPAAGQTATPPPGLLAPGPSAVNLTNITADSSVVAVAARGVAVDLATGEATPFVASLSAQFPDMSYQELLAIVAQGGSVTSSFSATFIVVPEPAGLALLGLGGLALIGRRRRI
jgi:hypothetical protein